ncbi:hypothetical protein CsatB_008396 [Cannabis sativa]
MSAAPPVPLPTEGPSAQVPSPSAGIDKEIDSWFQQGEIIGAAIQGETLHSAAVQGETSQSAAVQGEPSHVAVVQGEISTVAPSSAPDGGDSRVIGSCVPLVSYSSSD